MKRHKLTRSALVSTETHDLIEWPMGTTVWTTGETVREDLVEVVPYPGSEFRVWFQRSDLRPTEDA